VKSRSRDARGLLRRRTVSPVAEIYIGKESNRLEDVEVGLIHRLGEFLDAYAEARKGSWERLVRPVLRDIPARWLAERTGLSRRTIQRLRNGYSRPRRDHEGALTVIAVGYSRDRIRERAIEPPQSDLACLQKYLQLSELV